MEREHSSVDILHPETLKNLEHAPKHEKSVDGESHQHKQEEISKAREAISHTEQESTPTPVVVPLKPERHQFQQTYSQAVKSLQRRLSPASRAFSQVIHQPVVETLSNSAEKTIARPSLLLGAITGALIVTVVLYVVARSNGYVFTPIFSIAALIIGGAVGLVLEFLRFAFTGRSKR